MTTKEATLRAIHEIEDDLTKQVAYLRVYRQRIRGQTIYTNE